MGKPLVGRHLTSCHFYHNDPLGHSNAPQDKGYTTQNHLDSKNRAGMALEFWLDCSNNQADRLWAQFFQGGKMCRLDTHSPRNCCWTGGRSCQQDRGGTQIYYVHQYCFGRFHLDMVLGCLWHLNSIGQLDMERW